MSQETLNLIADYNRKILYEGDELAETSVNTINQLAGIKVADYLKRNKRVFISCIYKRLKDQGYETLLDLVMTEEFERDREKVKTIKLVLSSFDPKIREVVKSFDENKNTETEEITNIFLNGEKWYEIQAVTTKELQWTLKKCLKKIETLEVEHKHGFIDYDMTNIILVRKVCKNIKLRSIFFRLIHNDIFTHKKMAKYKMVDSDKCPRCGMVEDLKHMMWECREASNIWNAYNLFLEENECRNLKVLNYQEIFEVGNSTILTMVKLKIIQALIQIIRPEKWTKDNVYTIVNDLKEIDNYNSAENFTLEKFKSRWKILIQR
jgi:hypothetical protein